MHRRIAPRIANGRAIAGSATLLLAAACYHGTSGTGGGSGASEGSSGGSASEGGSDESGGDTSPSVCEGELSVSPLRRLSEVQYRNTLRDLFAEDGIDVETAAASELDRIPADDAGSTFGILDGRVSDQHARAYYRIADELAGIVAWDDASLAAVAGDCALETDPGDACIDAFLDDFGLRVYRRPLVADERERYHALTDEAADGPELFRSVIFSMLLAPQFLYHVEVDGDGDDAAFALGGYELASRLSFHFWQSMPDAELFAAAADGTLLADEGYQAQLERVFADPRTQATVDRFYDEWLQLAWLTEFPTTPAFATFAEGTTIGQDGADHLQAAQAEIHALARHYTFEADGTFADLLTSDLSLTTSPHLAALYGVEPWDGVSEPPRMPDGQRAGLLTRTAFLLTGDHESHPVHRGAAVRRRILCEELPTPDPTQLPPGALDPPPVTDDQTTRERYEAKTSDAACQGCHGLINPVGFVLEQYDALGRWRNEEIVIDDVTGEVLATLPIDSSAAPGLAGDDAPISTGAELSAQIVASGQTEGCFAKQYFRATFGREEGADDVCVIDELTTMQTEGASLGEVLRELAMQPVFRQRRVL